MIRIYYSSDKQLSTFVYNLKFRKDEVYEIIQDMVAMIKIIRQESFDLGAAYAGMDTTKFTPSLKEKLIHKLFNSRLFFKVEESCPTIYIFQLASNLPHNQLFSIGAGNIQSAVHKFALEIKKVPNLAVHIPDDTGEIISNQEGTFFGEFKILTIHKQRFTEL